MLIERNVQIEPMANEVAMFINNEERNILGFLHFLEKDGKLFFRGNVAVQNEHPFPVLYHVYEKHFTASTLNNMDA